MKCVSRIQNRIIFYTVQEHLAVFLISARVILKNAAVKMARNICLHSGIPNSNFLSTNLLSEPFEVIQSQLINREKEFTGHIRRVSIFLESRLPVLTWAPGFQQYRRITFRLMLRNGLFSFGKSSNAIELSSNLCWNCGTMRSLSVSGRQHFKATMLFTRRSYQRKSV